MKRKYDVENLKSIEESSIEELIEKFNSIDQYFKENYCKEFQVIFSGYSSEKELKEIECQIIKKVLESVKTVLTILTIRSIDKSTLKIDFKEKVSLRFIINVRNFIKSVEELECESIEYHNEAEYQYESIILKVKCKK